MHEVDSRIMFSLKRKRKKKKKKKTTRTPRQAALEEFSDI